jgi:hypothetical protein
MIDELGRRVRDAIGRILVRVRMQLELDHMIKCRGIGANIQSRVPRVGNNESPAFAKASARQAGIDYK